MTRLRAMVVSLTTDPGENSQTEEQLYVGLWGTSGGREFPLRSKDFDEQGGSFAAGMTRVFLLGYFPTGVAPTEGRRSDRSALGEANDPAVLAIELTDVDYVYLRKQATGQKSDDDDAYRLTRTWVDLYGTATTGTATTATETTAKTPERRFGLDKLGSEEAPGLLFANEYGHQAWLKEVRIEPPPG
jgi:hypothetical protein